MFSYSIRFIGWAAASNRALEVSAKAASFRHSVPAAVAHGIALERIKLPYKTRPLFAQSLSLWSCEFVSVPLLRRQSERECQDTHVYHTTPPCDLASNLRPLLE